MSDFLYNVHLKGLNIAFSYAGTRETVNEAILKHNCDPLTAHLLGRAMTGAILSAAILPEEHRMNVCWKYQGALRTLVVDAGQDGSTRGFISPAQLGDVQDNEDSLYGDIGNLQVICSKNGTISNSGTAPISLHDVANDLAYFHCVSDQVETGIAAHIAFNADPENPINLSQGWMLQALPDCDLERFDRVRKRLDSPEVRLALGTEAAPEAQAQSIIAALVADETDFDGVQMDAAHAPHFACTCTAEKMGSVIRTLSIADRMEVVKKGESLHIKCQFCNTDYELTIEDCIKEWNTKVD